MAHMTLISRSFAFVGGIAAAMLAVPAHAGSALCRIDDVNGDGIADLAVASRLSTVDEFVAVVSGKDGKLLRLWRTSTTGDGFGASLVPVRRERVTSLVVLARGHHWMRTEQGTQIVPVGQPSLVQLDVLSGVSRTLDTRVEATSCIAPVADFDGDGASDVAVGAIRLQQAASVRSTRDGKTLLELCLALPGDYESRPFLAEGITGFPDVDGDGKPEIVVGASAARANDGTGAPADFARANPAAVAARGPRCIALCSGATGAVLATSCGESDGGDYGSELALLADLDGDDLPELAVVSPSRFVRVLSFDARERTFRKLFDLRAHTDLLIDEFGSSVSTVADTDGDGTAEIVTGADEWLPGARFFDEGYAEVWSGRTGAKLATLFQSSTEGVDVCGLPDIDGREGPDVALSIVPRKPERAESTRQTLRVVTARDGRTVWEIDVAALRTATPESK